MTNTTQTREQSMLNAFIHTAVMKKYIGPMQTDRMREMIHERQLKTVDDLRNWLRTGDGMSPNLASALGKILPPKDKEILGRYIVFTHLADGGMGSVWMAADPDDNYKMVVIKTLKMNLTHASEEFSLRFEREALIMEKLKHDNTVWCLDAARAADGTHFMVLEFIEDGDLKDLTEQFTRLNEALALCIFHQVTCGLCVAERLNLIHRDIKPANIFIGADGRAKLADFGIARSTEDDRTQLTMQGALVGSPLYMSPEQVFGEDDLDSRCDIYALGCMLYYMLSGSAPFTTQGHVQEILHMHCEAPIPNIQDVRPEVSILSADIIRMCMAKNKKDRYDNATKLLHVTEQALHALGLDITSIDSEFGPVSPSAQQASAELIAAMRADIPEETITQNLNILNHHSNDDRTVATDLNNAAHDDMTIATDFSPATDNDDVTLASNFAPPSDDFDTLALNKGTAEYLSTESSDPIRPTDTATGQGNPQQASEQHTFVDTLLARAPKTGDKYDTDVTLIKQPAETHDINGDILSAMNCPWVNLMPSNPGESLACMLFAKNDILMGKLRDAPVDLCLRNYPVPIHKAACQRISRQHLRLNYDTHTHAASLMDTGSGNGTIHQGISLAPNTAQIISSHEVAHIIIADAVELHVNCISSNSIPVYLLNGAAPSAKTAAFGIDSQHNYDAITITRPSNRPELSYAMVLRQVSIGGPDADISIPGATSTLECALYNGYWIWRTHAADQSNTTWQPLTNGTTLQIANRHLTARPGAYQDFH